MSSDNSRASVARNDSVSSLQHGKVEEKPSKKRGTSKPPKPKPEELSCDDVDMCCNCDKLKTEAYFNFMSEFNMRHKGWTSTKVVLEGAKCWCEMTCKKRRQYLRRPEVKKRVSFKTADEMNPKAARRRLRSPAPGGKKRKRPLNFRR